MNRLAWLPAGSAGPAPFLAGVAVCASMGIASAQTSVPLAGQAPDLGVAYGALDVPDFSYAGLGNAAAEPPDPIAAGYAVFSVTDFGAVPGDGQSDRLAIQSAVDAAEASGGPAVVQFPPGQFILRGENEFGAEGVRVRGDRIVLRVAGPYSGGTELLVLGMSTGRFAIEFEPDLDPTVSWRGFRVLTDLVELPKRGDREVLVENASGVQPGDVVRLSAVLPDTFDAFRAYFEPLGDDAVCTPRSGPGLAE
ncbi:MAG: glycosyl hydrolase family 28-related protein, partial [Planctomycetota bacterium]